MGKQGRDFFLCYKPQTHLSTCKHGQTLHTTMPYRIILSKEYVYLFYKENER